MMIMIEKLLENLFLLYFSTAHKYITTTIEEMPVVQYAYLKLKAFNFLSPKKDIHSFIPKQFCFFFPKDKKQ